MYYSVASKFSLAIFVSLAWFFLCTYLSLPWIKELAQFVGTPTASIIIFLIALLPGFMNAFLIVAFIIDKRPKLNPTTNWPDISVLIPAHNEEGQIKQTIQSLLNQDYLGHIEIIVIDNASTDTTLSLIKSFDLENLIVLEEQKKGKSFALNKGLAIAKHDYILTLDADTFLLSDAVSQLMLTFLNAPKNTAAVAGSIYVRNSRKNFITRIQEWDYFHAIASIKRVQSLFQGTLVAQGAFSLYRKECIKEVGGWANTVGEDIVLTWGMLEKNYRIDFAEGALSFTNVPDTYRAFFFQRSRWSRGMIEAFIAHPKILFNPRLITFLMYWDLFFPAIDTAFIFIFIPGIIAAFFGYFFIAGPMTLAVLPLSILMNIIFLHRQGDMFHRKNLKIRRNRLGFLYYLLFYSILMSPACIHGYLSEIASMAKRWGTK
ncbi:glycosyltransferase family 2 protein [Fluoribacter gormanii]|uniref:glycosyltransferase family 2 protein n=1 Tax=Fluoribacter gormanii TaxID=464 RepID=UPI0010418E48|nr:glycosyltransferase [Fluoribacter gormanii]